MLPDGSEVAVADVYEVLLEGQSANGCDSVVGVTLTENLGLEARELVTVCDADVFDWNGETYSESGIYTLDLQTVAGCDSTLILNLTLNQF